MSKYIAINGGSPYKNYEQRTKRCLWCASEYCDVTKHNSIKTCNIDCKFWASTKLSQQVINEILTLYQQGCSIFDIQKRFVIAKAKLQRIMHFVGIMRNEKQRKGALTPAKPRGTKHCAHCNNLFDFYSNRHRYCNECVPDANGKFAKYIKNTGLVTKIT